MEWHLFMLEGTIVRKELNNEVIKVDTGCIAAFSTGLDYDIQKAGNLKSMFFGGEGLFLATLQGTGTVYLQSLPFSRLADRVIAHAPKIWRFLQGRGVYFGRNRPDVRWRLIMARKTWKEKFESKSEPEIRRPENAFADITAGSTMLIATPGIIADYITSIPRGKHADVKKIRRDLAATYHAEYTCPVTTGIFLRIVAETALRGAYGGQIARGGDTFLASY